VQPRFRGAKFYEVAVIDEGEENGEDEDGDGEDGGSVAALAPEEGRCSFSGGEIKKTKRTKKRTRTYQQAWNVEAPDIRACKKAIVQAAAAAAVM
jgi:hypothetical protein